MPETLLSQTPLDTFHMYTCQVDTCSTLNGHVLNSTRTLAQLEIDTLLNSKWTLAQLEVVAQLEVGTCSTRSGHVLTQLEMGTCSNRSGHLFNSKWTLALLNSKCTTRSGHLLSSKWLSIQLDICSNVHLTSTTTTPRPRPR